MAEYVLLSTLLPTVLKKTGSLIEQQLVELWAGSSDLKRELEKLQHVLYIIQSVLQDAEVKQTRDKHLRLWLSHLKEAAYDAEDLLDDIDIHLTRKQRLREDQSPIAVMGLKLTSSSQLWKRFPSIRVLDIRLCSGLEGFHPEGLLGLTALRQLFLIDNPQLAALPEGMGHLPALKHLALRDLPMLRSSLLDGYKSLERLWVKGCPGVESSLELLTLQRPSLQILTDGWVYRIAS